MFRVEVFFAFAAIILAVLAGGGIEREAAWSFPVLGLSIVALAICTGRMQRAALDVRDALALTQPTTVGVVQGTMANLDPQMGMCVVSDPRSGFRPLTELYTARVGGRLVLVLEGGEDIDG